MDYKKIKTNSAMNKSVKINLKLHGDNVSLYALKRIEELEEKVKKQQVYAEQKWNEGCKTTLSDISVCFLDAGNLKKVKEEREKIVLSAIGKKIKDFPLPKFVK